MDLKLTPKKQNPLHSFEIFSSDSLENYISNQAKKRECSIVTLSPEAEDIYARHTKFFKSIGAHNKSIEEKWRPNMSMVFRFDNNISLSAEQLDELLQIIIEQGTDIEVIMKTDGSLEINYTVFNALVERQVK